MWSKWNTPSLVMGVQTCMSTLVISMVVSQKTGNKPISRPRNTTLRYIPKGCSRIIQGLCSTMFIAALFVVARTWKQTRCPSTKERIKKMWYIYTMQYYSGVKNTDILKFACKWMELEKIILSEVTQIKISTI